MKDMQTVVVGYDGSADARRAVEAAGGIAAGGGDVHIVVAYKTPSAADTHRLLKNVPAEFHSVLDVLSTPQGYMMEAERMLDGYGVAHKSHIVEDHAASAILDVAEDVGADLVVVGSRGLGRAARFARGSVSLRVANNAHASVLIMHSDEH